MIPENINIDDLADQLNADRIALESINDPLHHDLEFALSYAEEKGLENTGVVIIDHIPAHYSNMRDIAQELAFRAGLDTVILKAPGGGAIVSTDYSRAEIEAAQGAFFMEPNYGLGVRLLVDDLVLGSINYLYLGVGVVFIIVLGIALALRKTRLIGG